MLRPPPNSTRTDTLFPYTPLFLSRLAAVRELVVVGVGGDGAVRVFVQQVVRAQGQRPAVAGLEAGRGVHRPRRAVGLVEGRVAALADAGGEFAVARRAQGEAPTYEVPVGAQGDPFAREALPAPDRHRARWGK